MVNPCESRFLLFFEEQTLYINPYCRYFEVETGVPLKFHVNIGNALKTLILIGKMMINNWLRGSFRFFKTLQGGAPG